MLAAFLLLLLVGALAVIAFSIGLAWLFLSESADKEALPARQPLSLTQTFARDLEARRVWRALSAWMQARPLKIEDRRGRRQD